jgi:hypothetical protein
MVGHRGTETNPDEVDTIHNMTKPSCKKDVMKLTCMMVALRLFHQQAQRKSYVFIQDIEESR